MYWFNHHESVTCSHWLYYCQWEQVSRWKDSFLSVGRWTTYDVTAQRPDQTWSIFYQNCAKDAPWAVLNFSTIRPAARRLSPKKKLVGMASSLTGLRLMCSQRFYRHRQRFYRHRRRIIKRLMLRWRWREDWGCPSKGVFPGAPLLSVLSYFPASQSCVIYGPAKITRGPLATAHTNVCNSSLCLIHSARCSCVALWWGKIYCDVIHF